TPLGPSPVHPGPGYAGYGPASWPPPGYPPPYAYPGGAPGGTGGGRIVAVVVTVVAVVVLAVCGCLGVGVLGSLTEGEAGPDEGPWPTELDDTAGADGESPAATPTRSPAVTPSAGTGRFSVVYEVTGAGPVDIQFYDANGDFLEYEEVASPWRLAISADDRERVQVLVQPGEEAESDTVGCRITIDGKVVSTDTDDYGATCFGW
ncbi:MmpS family transport accessory protein, partial [Micromonospora sp. NPDC003776]